MRTTRTMRRRGQATVELALGTISFIVVVMGGIYFGEIGMLSVKATEASAAAMWDAAGRPAHHYQNNGKLKVRYDDVAKDAQQRVADQYRDFDGRDAYPGSTPVLVFTRASDLQVECETLDTNDLPRLAFNGSIDGEVVGNDGHGGVRCRSNTSVSLIPGNPGQQVYTEEGWLRGPILSSAQIPICGIGRAWNGKCSEGTPMLLGDWGLSNRDHNEDRECHLNQESGCGNPGYYGAAKAYYDKVGAKGRKGSAFAREIIGMTPLPMGEDKFWMSFRGEESQFQERLNGTMIGRTSFTTTPGGDPHGSSIDVYKKAFDQRRDDGSGNNGRGCWLGMRCEDY